MRLVSARDAKTHLSACLDESQKQEIVVTHHGRPPSVMMGVDRYDLADVTLMLNPNFSKMIESRRRREAGKEAQALTRSSRCGLSRVTMSLWSRDTSPPTPRRFEWRC